MTALAAPRNTPKLGMNTVNDRLALKVAASAVIYQGGMVVIDAGYAKPATAAAGKIVAGVSEGLRGVGGLVDNTGGSDGDLTVVVRRGTHKFNIGSSSITQAHVGLLCYASDDNTVVLSDLVSGQVGRSIAGKIIQVDSDGVWVEFLKLENPTDTPPKMIMTLPIELASIADGDIVGAITPGFAGRILKTAFVTNKPATTAAKLSTLTPKIGTTAVTGGVLALTSANQTPMGNVVAGTAVTAANVFTATDTIKVTASATTAFVEGNGSLLLFLG